VKHLRVIPADESGHLRKTCRREIEARLRRHAKGLEPARHEALLVQRRRALSRAQPQPAWTLSQRKPRWIGEHAERRPVLAQLGSIEIIALWHHWPRMRRELGGRGDFDIG